MPPGIGYPDDEDAFRRWYAQQASRWDLDPDPDNPLHFYDYRSAFKAGVTPDESGHWPSDFKREGHPNLVVEGYDTRTGEQVDPNAGPRTAGHGWQDIPDSDPSLISRFLRATKDAGRQGARGLAESGIATARGVDALLPFVDWSEGLDETSAQVEDFYGEPESLAGKISKPAARVLGDLAQFAVPGRALARTGTLANLGRGQRIGAEVAAGLPVDAVTEAGSEEGGTAGVLAMLAEKADLSPAVSGTLEKASESPFGRAVVGSGTSAALGSLLATAPDMLRSLRSDRSGHLVGPGGETGSVLAEMLERAKGPRSKAPGKESGRSMSLGEFRNRGGGVEHPDLHKAYFDEAMEYADFHGEIDGLDVWDPSQGLPDSVLSDRGALLGVPEEVASRLPEDEQRMLAALRREMGELPRSRPRPVNTLDELASAQSDLPFEYDPKLEQSFAEGVMPGTGGRSQHPGPKLPPSLTFDPEVRVGQPLTVFESPRGTKFSVLDEGSEKASFRLYDDELNPLTDVQAKLSRLLDTGMDVGDNADFIDYNTIDEILDQEAIGDIPTSPAITTDAFNPVSGSPSDTSLSGKVGNKAMLQAADNIFAVMARKAMDVGEDLPEFLTGHRITGASEGGQQSVSTSRSLRRLIEDVREGRGSREFATILRQLGLLAPAGIASQIGDER